MAWLSLALSISSFFVFWLLIPMFILPPLSFFVGYKAYVAGGRRDPGRGRARQVLACFPMAFAVAVFAFQAFLLLTEYNV